MISFNVLFFWISILFVFWLETFGAKKAGQDDKPPLPVAEPALVRS